MIHVGVKPLRAAMKALAGVVEARNTIPILDDVMIQSTPGSMVMTVTDLDMMAQLHLDLAEPGKNKAMAFCVAADVLEKIAAKLPADGVATIAADGNMGITVSCGRSRFKLPTLPIDDFPIMPFDDDAVHFEMPGGGFQALIDSVRFAISTEETRYYLNGIFLHAVDGHLRGAATDGSRLARYITDLPEGGEGMADSIVGRKCIGVLDKLLDKHEAPIAVSLSGKKIRVEIGTVTVTAKLVDGTFPDYTRVIPAANDKAIWFDPKAMVEAVDRVAVISSEKTRLIRMDVGRDVVTLTVASPENGQAIEEVPVDYQGEPITMGFNGSYLLDVLRHLTSDTAQVLLADPSAPSLWRDSEAAARLYVLMPMRV
ncbi:DNA polymerase III subunit beta [soil metagenome]